MADKTTGELTAVNVSDLTAAADIYDDFKMPGEFQGEAVHVTGGQMKQYAVSSVKPFADSARNDAATAKTAAASAEVARTASQSALAGVQNALNNLPTGSTVVIDDLTTGGTAAALSAEQGKILAQRPNPNLLHNWYFANCVNQRGRTAYAGKVYGIDCWKNAADTTITVVPEKYVTCSAGTILQHPLESSVVAAITDVPVTFSVLMDYGFVYGTATYDGKAGKVFYGDDTTKVKLQISGRGHPYITANTAVNIIAVKLELGSIQTLAHDNDLLLWELNEIPDYGEELLKCQRYYQLFTSAEKRPTDKRDFRPELRTNATSANTGTIAIGGVTYYYADAVVG